MKQRKKNLNAQIITRRKAENQVNTLTKQIRDRKLTQALISLEEYGIQGDLAIFLVAILQDMGEVKA